MTLMADIIVLCLSPSKAGRQVRPRPFAGGQAEALRVAHWSGWDGGENENSASQFLVSPPPSTHEFKSTQALTFSTGIQCRSCPLTSMGSWSPAGVWVKDQNTVGT